MSEVADIGDEIKVQWSLFDNSGQKLTSNIFDKSGIEIQIGHKLMLVFNKGTYQEHKAEFDVVWSDAAYRIKSVETGNLSYLGSIHSNVEIEVIS